MRVHTIRLDSSYKNRPFRMQKIKQIAAPMSWRTLAKYLLLGIAGLCLGCGLVGLCRAEEVAAKPNITAKPVTTSTVPASVSTTTTSVVVNSTTVVNAAPCATCESKCTKCEIDYWMISTRNLSGYCNGLDEENGPGFCITHRVCSTSPSTVTQSINNETVSAAPTTCERCEWKTAKLDELLAVAADNRETWIMIHGNRTSACEGSDFGWSASQAVCQCGCNEKPRRVIIWSWPSDQIRGPLNDVRAKADRACSESVYLSWLVRKLPRQTPICFIGHSFGPRIATGTLHLLAGGELNGYVMPAQYQIKTKSAPDAPKFRGVFLASAFDSCWIMPGSCFGNALSITEKMLFVNNSCDPVLKLYPHIDKCTKPEAAGYCGVMVSAQDQEKIVQMDAAPCLGKTHDYSEYLRASNLLAAMCRHAQFDAKP